MGSNFPILNGDAERTANECAQKQIFAVETIQTEERSIAFDKIVWIATVLSAIGLLIALAWPMFRGEVYIADDLGEFHLPLRAFYARQLDRGEAFDWCPDLYCGFYLTGEGQVGAYHPLHLLLYRTLPLWLAFDLECWISYPLLLIGMFFLLRRWRIGRKAALFGGIAFTFGGFNLLHFVHPNAIAVIAHLPWLLLAIDVLIASPQPFSRRFAFAAIALLTASELLLGYPQYVLFSLLLEGEYALWIARSNSNSIIAAGRKIGCVAVAISFGFCIGAIQFLPTIDALQNSVRRSTAVDFALQGSLHPLNLLQLVAPYLFGTRVVGENTHELGLYVGAIPLALTLYCLLKRNELQLRNLIVAATVVAIVALGWALGGFGPLGWLQTHSPLLEKFRFPCRAIVIFQFAIAILAALGMLLLCRPAQTHVRDVQKHSMPAGLWWLPIVSTATAIAGAILWPQYVSAWPLIVVGPCVMFAAVLLIHAAVKNVRWAIPALVVLSAVDLGIYGLSKSVFGHIDSLATYIASTSAPPHDNLIKRVALESRESSAISNQLRAGDRILLAGWKRADGYSGLEPARRLDYRQPATLAVAGVGWLPADATALENGIWKKLSPMQPRAWLVTKTIVSADPASDISRISIADTALVEEPPDLPIGNSGEVKILLDRPGKLAFSTQSSSEQLLVVNESFHPGWNAIMDAANAKILRVDGDFLGVVVPAGTHRISLNFEPRSLQWGRTISSFGLGFIVATLLWPVRPRRAKPSHRA